MHYSQITGEWRIEGKSKDKSNIKVYNILFNSNRPREHDGSHINFSGMNPEITLRKHKVNAIATGDYDAIIMGHPSASSGSGLFWSSRWTRSF